MNENDFVTGELEEIKIGERVFKIKPLTGKEGDEILDKNLIVDEDGKMSASLVVRNEEWFRRCVVDAPYEKDGKPFKDLKSEERVEIIQKLKPVIRTRLIKELSKVNDGTVEEKKSLN
jgi:hypothetical protein